MSELATVVSLALLPAAGNFAGGMLAELWRPSKINLNRALHASAGIVLAIVAIELLPHALQSTSGWVVGTAFGLGGSAYLGLQTLALRAQPSGATDLARMWVIYIAVAVDLFSDGLMIGVGASLGTGLALLLALGQMLADVPEGFATVANLRDKGVAQSRRMLLSLAFAVPALIAAVGAYFLLRNQSELVQVGALVFISGLLTVAAVEDMISEAHESAKDKRGSVLAMVLGFVLFTLISAGLGQD